MFNVTVQKNKRTNYTKFKGKKNETKTTVILTRYMHFEFWMKQHCFNRTINISQLLYFVVVNIWNVRYTLFFIYKATTESLPTTDLIFTTSELSTPSSDIISTDLIFPTSDLTTLISDTMPSTIETTNPNTVSSSVQTTIATNSANVPSTIETTKPSTVSSSIKTTIATTSTHVPSTKYSYSSSTRKPFNTASSTLTPTRKSTTTLFSSKPTNTVTSTVRPTTKHMSVSPSYNLPKYTNGSKVSELHT